MSSLKGKAHRLLSFGKASFFLFSLVLLVNMFSLSSCQRSANPLVDNDSEHPSNRKVYFKPNELDGAEYDEPETEDSNDMEDLSEEITSIEKKMDDELLSERKKDALIQVFKVKLLELLGVDEVPNVFDFDKSQIPEAIYKHAVHINKVGLHKDVYKRVKNGKILRHRIRKNRRENANEDNDDDEHIRFNSSITKEITLFTQQLDETNKSADWCHQASYNARYDTLVPLKCFKFNIDQDVFKNRIQSAKLYFKLDNDAIAEKFSEPLFVFQPSTFNRKGYLYIEVNGFLIKKIDLTRIKAINEDYAFKNVEIRNVVNEIIAYNENPHLKIRFLAGEDLISQFDSLDSLKSLLIGMDENMALNVKFGGMDDMNQDKRRKRTFGTDIRGAGHHFKLTRDCKDLRRMGYTSSNYSCCRESLSVTMEQLGWSHWILSPKVIEYKYCRGGCLTGQAPRFDNTHIIYRMFELSNTFETAHCCNIYDYEEPITFIYGKPPNFQKRLISLNAKNCLCS